MAFVLKVALGTFLGFFLALLVGFALIKRHLRKQGDSNNPWLRSNPGSWRVTGGLLQLGIGLGILLGASSLIADMSISNKFVLQLAPWLFRGLGVVSLLFGGLLLATALVPDSRS